jgi:nucleotide-binding universal stress UspA family protein
MKVKINTILCPVDFSENSEHALNYALTLAILNKAKLHLLHVVEPFTYPLMAETFGPQLQEVEIAMEIERAAQKQLDDRVAGLTIEYPNVAGRQITGNPFIEIIQAARSLQADLIVMGTHGRTGLAHILIGSVAEKIVREAPCPVLTVKHPEHKFVKL